MTTPPPPQTRNAQKEHKVYGKILTLNNKIYQTFLCEAENICSMYPLFIKLNIIRYMKQNPVFT